MEQNSLISQIIFSLADHLKIYNKSKAPQKKQSHVTIKYLENKIFSNKMTQTQKYNTWQTKKILKIIF